MKASDDHRYQPPLGEPIRDPAMRQQAIHRFHLSGSTIRSLNGSAADAQAFFEKLETLHSHALVIGEQLGMQRLKHGVVQENGHTFAFRFHEVDASHEEVMGLTANLPLQCSEALDELQQI